MTPETTMSDLPHQSLDGPDFLEAISDIELGMGHTVNADAYRQRAREYRQLQSDHEALIARNGTLQIALDKARNAIAQVPKAA